MTGDNASTIDNVVKVTDDSGCKILGDVVRLRCIPHMADLVFKAAAASGSDAPGAHPVSASSDVAGEGSSDSAEQEGPAEYTSDVIDKVKRIATFFRTSSSAAFKLTAERLKVTVCGCVAIGIIVIASAVPDVVEYCLYWQRMAQNGKRILGNSPHRWYSTLFTLKSAVDAKDDIDAVLESLPGHDDMQMSTEEWTAVQELILVQEVKTTFNLKLCQLVTPGAL